MNHQLVLQFPFLVDDDLDRLFEAEDLLIERLPEDVVVDGHDYGSGQMNIFILTSDPASTFAQAKQALSGHPLQATLRAAYRESDSEEYVVLWPEGLRAFEVT